MGEFTVPPSPRDPGVTERVAQEALPLDWSLQGHTWAHTISTPPQVPAGLVPNSPLTSKRGIWGNSSKWALLAFCLQKSCKPYILLNNIDRLALQRE